MTSPRATYGGGYTPRRLSRTPPIYDSLVAERGTPQIAPIRVPSVYDTGNSSSRLCGPRLPALPAGPSQHVPAYGNPQAMAQPVPMQQGRPSTFRSRPRPPAAMQVLSSSARQAVPATRRCARRRRARRPRRTTIRTTARTRGADTESPVSMCEPGGRMKAMPESGYAVFQGIHVYPVKSLAGHRAGSVRVWN